MKRIAVAASAAILAMGIGACSQNTQDQTAEAANAIGSDISATTSNAVSDVSAATDRALGSAENTLDGAGDRIEAGADRTGTAIENGADRAGRAIDRETERARTATGEALTDTGNSLKER